ncbi:DUF1499 domain-containing protein [Vibrio cyclitrophicus]|uniref:DUF1499 domain-containing protein n=1 Tax=Vibrio cyclitrophicus ZF270 TaxID=1136176 RepID=A0AAN0NBK9_9VIBR|nr:DUF1499 domain-containing protein [Vibrio cyclitrophicus]MBU2932095.1 DUF1499 domain-containing protein [Vibrio cyclitrophicus]OBT29913.1 hypothetical protein A9263_00820 [Vibrio cyclitrophicus]OEE03301.1 hypothetical protein OC7_15625 [Vibrio cyclitrophicus ZF270]OEE24457.1 hypothetical protein OAM_18015 [Vibrio cyclitrophicus ZF14]PMF63637.1 hypothetical protein BCV09_08805 [Vibrio cyclitrophicus]
MTNNRTSRIGTLLLVIAFTALLMVAVMIFGSRMGLWDPIVGFGYIRNYLNPIGLSLLALSTLGLIYQWITRDRTGALKSLVAAFIGLGLIAPMLHGITHPVKREPAIHDITTDTINPPEFYKLDDTRAGAKNSLIYAGEEVAAIQKKLYPYIKPIQSNLSSEDAYAKALDIAKNSGWEVVAGYPEALRFEATAQTTFFGFMDDVVVQVTQINNKSRIDIRSVSRIGRSDKGVNAARIVEFTESFNQ